MLHDIRINELVFDISEMEQDIIRGSTETEF